MTLTNVSNPPLYDVGTISLAQGSDIVSGTGTAWQYQVVKYGVLTVSGQAGIFYIDEVISDTQIRLNRPWPYTSLTDVSYFIFTQFGSITDAKLHNAIAAVLDRVEKSLAVHVFQEHELDVNGTPINTVGNDNDLGLTFDANGAIISSWQKIDGAWANETSLKGAQGDAGTITVGQVNTGVAGSEVVITNTGTPQSAVFEITIPRGDQGDPGDMSGANNLSELTDPSQALANLGARELLTSARTYHVNPSTGLDSNDGLSAANPFATIGKALDTVKRLDHNGFAITIQLSDGTYNENIIVPTIPGKRAITDFRIEGNITNPENVIVNGNGSWPGPFQAQTPGAICRVRGITFGNTANNSIYCVGGASVQFGLVRFGPSSGACINVSDGSYLSQIDDCEIFGDVQRYIIAQLNSVIRISFVSVALSNTPAFSAQFLRADLGAAIYAQSFTYTGSATGQRYSISLNSSVQTFGGGESYFPGDGVGAISGGAQYN